MKAAIVQDLGEEALLGRDVPLHKHMVKRLPRGLQMELLHQLARDNKVKLKEKPEDKDWSLGIEFPFDEELFEKPGKPRAHLTRTEKRRHNQQWTRLDGSTVTAQLKIELTRELGDLNERLGSREELPQHRLSSTGKGNRTWPNFKKTARPRNRNTSRSWVT